MIKRTLAIALVVAAFPFLSPGADELTDGFRHPPDTARPRTWWHWINGYVTKPGITADLEAMKRIGLAGFQLFDGDLKVEIPELKSVPYMSQEYLELLRHTATEAKRLGLEFTMVACPGWSQLGAPWVEPDAAMQRMVWSERQVVGPTRFAEALPPLPASNEAVSLKKKPRPEPPNAASQTPPQAVDSCVVAYRLAEAGATPVINPVVDLTSKLGKDGILTWDVPEGKWEILRVGSHPMRTMNHPARPAATGLETDKLSAGATRNYFAEMMKRIGPSVEGGLKAFLVDSWEAGDQDWTPTFIQDFKRLRGYDPTPYMPVAIGKTVISKEVSERFMRDVRRTRADLVADNFFGVMNELIAKNGYSFYAEAPGIGNHFGDKLQCKSRVAIPMAEFWTPNRTNQAIDAYAKHPIAIPDCKEAASSAHLTGKTIVAAEAFTSGGNHAPWQQHPFSMKAEADFQFAMGITRFCFHTFAMQPWLDRAPGMTMGPFGHHFNRNATWWEHGGREWIEYLSRCEYLLMQGRFVADVCLFWGEDAPVSALSTWPDTKNVPAGYDFDLCDAEMLLQARVRDGRVSLPSGMSYRVLYIPARITTLSPEMAAKVRELVSGGATVLAGRPGRAPGLKDYPQCDGQVRQIADEVWGDAAVVDRKIGTGRIISGKPLAEVLASAGIEPDVMLGPVTPRGYKWIHRRIEERNLDLYFVSSQHPEAVQAEASFRVTGREPEFWDAATGAIAPAKGWRVENGRTIVPLPLDPYGSLFVVFSRPATARAGEPPCAPAVVGSLPLNGAWTVAFPAGCGAPAQITMATLVPLHDHADEGVKYFAGTATYTKAFDMPAGFASGTNRVRLALGDVQVIAEVFLNGHAVATLWKPPFTVDVTQALKAGGNTLEVKVTNLWPNRVIGDLQAVPGKQPVAQLAVPSQYYKKNPALLPSGLIGPVVVETIK